MIQVEAHVCVYCKLSQLRTKTTGFVADSDSRTVCTVAKVALGKEQRRSDSLELC